MFQKALSLEIESTEEATGIVRAYVAGFGNIDRVGDIIVRGAFAKTIPQFLAEGIVLWNHDTNTPIGKPLTAVEDEKGLLVEFQLDLDNPKAKEIFGLMKSGVIKKFSIGYDVKSRDWLTEDNMTKYAPQDATASQIAAALRWGAALLEIELYEISPVSIPANPNTSVEEIKAKALSDAAPKPTTDEDAPDAKSAPSAARVALTQAKFRQAKRRRAARANSSTNL